LYTLGFSPQALAMSIGPSTIAIVTGGSRGIGFATASALVARGASVGITGTDERRLEDARVALSGTDGARVLALRADVRVEAEVAQAVTRVVAAWGGLDILVNNAGVGGFVEVSEMTSADWHRVIDTNLTGVYHCCHAALPHLKARGGGWIINVSSLAGSNAFVGGAAYCASKAGLNAFSESLMQEVRHHGIRVSIVAPGSVRTGFSSGDGPGTDWKLAPDDVAQVIADLVDHPARSLPSRVEIRPSRPPRK
jgi:3-oxoacyl-[acyl-carrier protein] reductase